MVNLIAKSPADGLVPVTLGGLSLTEVPIAHITHLAPYGGRDEAMSNALAGAHGLGLPPVRRFEVLNDARVMWAGLRQFYLIGPAPADPSLAAHGAVTDQSDGWTVLTLDGEGARDVLSRLTPIDLNPALFPTGATARTLINHMTGSISRTGPESYEIMVMRSMAGTLVHELTAAMQSVAARARL